VTDSHKQDRQMVTRIQMALFRATNPGCEIEFLSQPLDEINAVHFVLGKNDAIVATRTTKKSLSWLPADGALIQIKGFPVPGNDQGVDASLDRQGNWGFLRLLAGGTPSTIDYKGVAYQSCEWDQFMLDGKPLSAGGKKARAALLFRTSAQPNPLEPGFFNHTFSDEVFGAR